MKSMLGVPFLLFEGTLDPLQPGTHLMKGRPNAMAAAVALSHTLVTLKKRNHKTSCTFLESLMVTSSHVNTRL